MNEPLVIPEDLKQDYLLCPVHSTNYNFTSGRVRKLIERIARLEAEAAKMAHMAEVWGKRLSELNQDNLVELEAENVALRAPVSVDEARMILRVQERSCHGIIYQTQIGYDALIASRKREEAGNG